MSAVDGVGLAALAFTLVFVTGTVAFRLGYWAAIRRNRRKLEDGEHYQAAVEEALEGCRGVSHIELTIQAKRVAEPERRGTGTLGLYVVPDDDAEQDGG